MYFAATNSFHFISTKLELEHLLSSGKASEVQGVISEYEVIRQDTGRVSFNVEGVKFITGESYGFHESKYLSSSIKNGYNAKIFYHPSTKVILKIELKKKDFENYIALKSKAKKRCVNEGVCQ